MDYNILLKANVSETELLDFCLKIENECIELTNNANSLLDEFKNSSFSKMVFIDHNDKKKVITDINEINKIRDENTTIDNNTNSAIYKFYKGNRLVYRKVITGIQCDEYRDRGVMYSKHIVKNKTIYDYYFSSLFQQLNIRRKDKDFEIIKNYMDILCGINCYVTSLNTNRKFDITISSDTYTVIEIPNKYLLKVIKDDFGNNLLDNLVASLFEKENKNYKEKKLNDLIEQGYKTIKEIKNNKNLC